MGEIPPLTFAGLRYSIAFMCLLPFALKKERVEEIKKIEQTLEKELDTIEKVQEKTRQFMSLFEGLNYKNQDDYKKIKEI